MQGWFDMEVQAKTVRRDMQRAAERQRLLDEAQSHGRRASSGPDFSVARLLHGARSWLAALWPVEAPVVERGAPAQANLSVIAAAEQAVAARPRPVASSDLYSGMVIIARGNQQRPLQEPSGARKR